MSDQPPIQPEGSTYAGTAAASTSEQTPVVDSAQETGSVQASTTSTAIDTAASDTAAGPAGVTEGSGPSSSDAAAIRAQVEKEQALKDAQRRVRALEEEVSRMKGDKMAVESERDAAVQSTNQLRTQLSSLQSAHHKSASELSVLQTRIEIVEREKKELLEETERQQDRSTRTNQELYTLRAQKGESAQKIAHLDVELSEMRLKAESAKFNENRAQDAVVAARAEILRMGKMTADVEERFGKYRAEKQSQYSSLQTEHDITLSRLTTAESSYQALQRSYNDQSARLAAAHADINDLTSSAASRKAASQTEVARLVEENRILTKRAEETREVVAEREAELEQLTAAYNEASETAEARIKTEERRRKEAEKKAAELKQTVDRLALAAGEGDNLSATAAVAQELKSQGKSYTEFFRDYTLQELRLQEAEEEVQRLTGVLDDIREDIAEKKPLLNEQAQEHAAAIDRANKLSAEIALVIAARDAYADTISSLRAEATHNSEEVTSLQSITNDLSRQVQNLLRQLAIRDDPSLANTPLDAPNGVNATEDVITERFTEFKSLRNLQEQNVKLLKLTRVLIGRLEQRDIKRTMAEDDEVDTVHSLEEAAETIEKLHAQLLDAQKRIHETTRERDMFSKLLARGEGLKYTSGASRLEDEILPGSGSGSGNGSAATIAGAAGSSAVQAQVVQANQEIIEALCAEIAGIRSKAEEEVKGVRDELKERMKAVGEAEVGRAKAEARAGMLQEQARSLQDVGNLEKQAKAGLETQIRQVQVSLQSAQNEARQSREQAALKQAEADRLRTDVAVLRAEKEQWTSTEARLQADFRTVQAERTRLTSLIENLNGVSTENDRSRGEERKRLETRVEELQRESTELRSQLSTATEAQIAASAKLTEAEAAHTSAIAALNEKITAHEAEIARAKTAGLSWRRQHNTLKETEIPALRAQITEAHTALENKEGEMTALHKQVGEAKREKEGLEGRLKDVNAQLDTVKRSEGLKEQTVQRLQSELSRKNGGAADTAALQTEKQKLQARVTELEGELATAKAVVPAAPAAATAGTGDAAEKEEKLQKLQDEVASWTKKYDEGVIKVNRANSSMKNRITELLTEKGTLTARIAELEEQIQNQPVAAGDAGASSTETTAGSTEVKSETVDQAAIDKAVKAAVSAKEFELNVAHAKALSDAKSAAAASSTATPAAPAAEDNSEAIKAAVSAKETELNTAFETRLAAAVSEARAPLAALEEEKKQLQIKIEALEEKIKALERQGRTAEISRKTLERTSAANTVVLAAIKAELEKKGIKLDTTIPAAVGTKPASAAATAPANAAATGSAAGSGSGSGSAPPTGPAAAATPASATPAGAAAPAGAQPPTGPAVTRSASVKGKGAVARPGGPGRGVLASVNATLAQAGSSTSQAQKRPAPEEGEIPEAEPSASTTSPTTASATTATSSEAGAGAGAGAGDVLARLQGQAQGQTGEATRGGRAIKRPRGAGRGGARGGATAGAAGAAAGRRPSAGNGNNNAGAGQGGGQPPASGGDGASS